MKRKVLRIIIVLGIVGILVSINSKKEDQLESLAVYIDNEYVSSIPDKNSDYVIDKIVCDDDIKASWDDYNWTLKLNSLNKKLKCNLYFRTDKITKDIIKSLDTSGKCPSMNRDGSVKIDGAETENSLVCRTLDNYGISYYYRGNVTNNYVYFAGYYFRILRINGDGSIRLIYDGTSIHKNSEASEDRIIGKSAFNDDASDNAYVGYMYGSVGSSTYLETHKNINDSTIKKYLDTWYENNLGNTKYAQYIVNNIFCSERTISEYHPDSNFVNLGYWKTLTQYRGSYGPWSASSDSNNAKMTYKCQNSNDILELPIGLITKDEGVLAGGYNTRNDNLFISDGNMNWTMSPDCYNDMDNYEEKGAANRCFFGSGFFSCDSNVTAELGVKPVINLKSGSLKSGDGTASSPYVLE